MSTTGTIKVYELYPVGNRFSATRGDYRGTAVQVAATSLRQAIALAHRGGWADLTSARPVGMLDMYQSGRGHRAACGCTGWDVPRYTHGKGIRHIRECIASHRCGA